MAIFKPTFPRLRRGHPLARGLIGAWLFSDKSGSVVQDQSDGGNAGSISGTTTWVGGPAGSALAFDGSSGYADAGTSSYLDLTHVGSLCALAYWTSGNSVCVGKGNIFGDRNGYGIYAFSNRWAFEIASATAANRVYSAATAATANEWQNLALTWDGSTVSGYINGKNVGTASQTLDASPSGLPFRIGCNGNTTPNAFFNGRVDDVLVYNRALSAQEVQRLCFDPFAMFRRDPILRPSAVAGHPYSYGFIFS